MKIVYLVNLLFQNQNMLNFKQYCYSPFFKLFILFLYFSTISSAFSQTDSLAGKSYKELTKLYYETIKENPKIATAYIDAAYKLVVKEKDTAKMVQILYTIANNKSGLSQNETALQNLEKAIPLAAQSKNNKFLFGLYNLKGIVYTDMGKYLKALDAYIKSKEYATLNNNKSNEIQASINIGFIKKMNQDYEEAISIFKESLEKINKIDLDSTYKKHYQRFLYINLVDTFLRVKEVGSDSYIEEAEFYNDLGFQISSKTKNANSYHTLLINKAIIYFEKEEYKESIELATDVKTYALNAKDTVSLGTTYFYLGKNYYFLEKYPDAVENFEKFYEIVQNSEKEYSNERQLHGLLGLSYFKVGESKKSKFHSKEHDRLLEEERKESIKVVSTIHTEHDLPKITQELNELSDAYKKEEIKKKWLYGISSFLIILLIGSIVFYRIKVKRIKKRVAEVLQKVTVLEQQQEEKQQKKSTTTSISDKGTDTKASLILEKLDDFEEQEAYLSLDCSLGFVAEKLDSNTSYVSNVINNYKNKTFKSYITELRINTALIRLKNDAKLRSYTIKAIAEEFGFKRQETFSKAFKSQTGIYPSQYLKKLRDDLEID